MRPGLVQQEVQDYYDADIITASKADHDHINRASESRFDEGSDGRASTAGDHGFWTAENLYADTKMPTAGGFRWS